jgi:hypothetical protein
MTPPWPGVPAGRGRDRTRLSAAGPPTTEPAADAAGTSSASAARTNAGGATGAAGRARLGARSVGQVKKTTAAQEATKTMKNRRGIGFILLRYNQKKNLQA